MRKRQANPFKPTAGKTPPLLVGRDDVLDDFIEGIDDGPGAPARLMRITGARGVGKTVLLNALGEIAKERSWDVIAETASEGLYARLVERLRLPKGLIDGWPLPSVSFAGVEVDFGAVQRNKDKMPIFLRDALALRLSKKRADEGVLITVDETQAANRDEMVAIATSVQHLIREDQNVAFVFAGLPSMDSRVLNDDVLTFLRRAVPERLSDVPLSEVRDAFAVVFDRAGASIDDEALDAATEATRGYPFMIQLVGYNIWRVSARRCENNSVSVTLDDAFQGIKDAKVRLGDTVHEPELEGLSAVDRTYLLSMAHDDGPSSTSAVAKRMGKSMAYANQYRTRLLEAQVIKEVARGKVDFAIPYLREYLREHEAFIQMMNGRGEGV